MSLRASIASLNSQVDLDARQVFTQVAIYKGSVVAVKRIDKKSVDLTRNVRKELKTVSFNTNSITRNRPRFWKITRWVGQLFCRKFTKFVDRRGCGCQISRVGQKYIITKSMKNFAVGLAKLEGGNWGTESSGCKNSKQERLQSWNTLPLATPK